MTTQNDIAIQIESGSWRVLERLAFSMCQHASQLANAEMNPVLGGGTRLMLDLKHRISDDIDLFISNPQWLGYLTPRLIDRFESEFSSYDENADFIKFSTTVGEIDFLVRAPLLNQPTTYSPLSLFPLEPIEEVLAKKLFYRGWAITPRDLFDWWCIEHMADTDKNALNISIANLMSNRIDRLENGLSALHASPKARTIWAAIRTPLEVDFDVANAWAKQKVNEYRDTPKPLKDRSLNEEPPTG